jgi:hypothetical protein
MTKKKLEKALDCVELKKELQEKVLKDRESLGAHEVVKHDEKIILKDPKLGPLWQRLVEKKHRKAS